MEAPVSEPGLNSPSRYACFWASWLGGSEYISLQVSFSFSDCSALELLVRN